MLVLKKFSTTYDELRTTMSGIDIEIDTNYEYLINLDTAHDNLAFAVLTEHSLLVAPSVNGAVIDTVTQSGTLGAKWFITAYDVSGNRYACEIYAMHDGNTNAGLVEYAILTVGSILNLDFEVVADGTNMSLMVDNNNAFSVTFKTQRNTVSTAVVNTTAIIS